LGLARTSVNIQNTPINSSTKYSESSPEKRLLARSIGSITEKNGFVTATKLGTTNEFLVASAKNFAAATKRFVDRTKHFVVVTKYFCYPYFNNWYNKIFFPVILEHVLCPFESGTEIFSDTKKMFS